MLIPSLIISSPHRPDQPSNQILPVQTPETLSFNHLTTGSCVVQDSEFIVAPAIGPTFSPEELQALASKGRRDLTLL